MNRTARWTSALSFSVCHSYSNENSSPISEKKRSKEKILRLWVLFTFLYMRSRYTMKKILLILDNLLPKWTKWSSDCDTNYFNQAFLVILVSLFLLRPVRDFTDQYTESLVHLMKFRAPRWEGNWPVVAATGFKCSLSQLYSVSFLRVFDVRADFKERECHCLI